MQGDGESEQFFERVTFKNHVFQYLYTMDEEIAAVQNASVPIHKHCMGNNKDYQLMERVG